MDKDQVEIQIRKFLKRVGVESHAAIDQAVAAASNDGAATPLRLKMTLEVAGAAPSERHFEAEIDIS